METETSELTFEKLPLAVTRLILKVDQLSTLLESKKQVNNPPKRVPINIDKVCDILNVAKSTVYRRSHTGSIPCYKSGRRLYYFEDEILKLIESGRRKTTQEIKIEANNITNKKC